MIRKLLLCGVGVLTLMPARSVAYEPSEQKLTGDASGVFALIADQAKYGYFGNKEVCQRLMIQYHLARKEGGALAAGTSWGIWTGENSSGSVSAYASFPDPMDKTKDHFWVRFEVGTETPMPEAMLTHLLAKARETIVSRGDALEIRLPYEQVGNCIQAYTLTVRITSGALVSTSVEDRCSVK